MNMNLLNMASYVFQYAYHKTLSLLDAMKKSFCDQIVQETQHNLPTAKNSWYYVFTY